MGLSDMAGSRLPLVYLASPYAGDVEAHVAYARRCLLDCIQRGEVPIAPHLLYPQVLDDSDPEQRGIGMACALALLLHVDRVVAYIDHGMSAGMEIEYDLAAQAGLPWEHRRIGP